ncbi:unnamed protein product, partial [Rotaria sp. Silwood2]
QAYRTGQLPTDNNSLLRYLDYATIEQHSSMTAASMFWSDALRACKIDHSLPLPFDRYRLSDEHRTGRGTCISFDFGEDLSRALITYSSSNDITPRQLTLAIYYVFLFKLTNGESDLCIGMNTNERYKEELMLVIGTFVNAIPLRCQLDPHWSFSQLSHDVKEIITNSLKHSYFPLQRILTQHSNVAKPAFLQTSFEFLPYTATSSKKEVMIGNARFVGAPFSIDIGEDEVLSKLDFTLTIQHDMDSNQLSCERCSAKLIKLLESNIDERCHIWNLCGPAETTLQSIFHRVNSKADKEIIPLGVPLPNYHCKIQDDFAQLVIVNQEAEVLIAGVGIFAAYLGRHDLTAKALVEIDGEIFYRTGDLVRIDHNGLLYYHGRKDHQIKLHGQRIELGEIEQCLLKTSISACVVIKWGDDHLIAYVQSCDVDTEQLHQHCQSHLPPHMIPSMFLVMEKLPTNANGKIDRKLLPIPDFSLLTNIDHTNLMPLTPLEEHLQRIFSQAFHSKSPNMNIPFRQLGGTSLDAIRALVLIRQEICTKVDAGLLFANPSIRQLARVIEPLLITYDESSATTTALQLQEDQDRSIPSLFWLIWTLISFSMALVLLKFIVGTITSGYYSINSYDYLHKLWLRQLIITSFHHALGFLPSYNILSSFILRWLGAHIEDNVKLAEFQQILRFPSNLLNIEHGVTTFGRASLTSFTMTKEGLCYVDEIYLGSDTNLGNGCTIMPGTTLPSKIIVGSLTLVTQKYTSAQSNCVLLGIPAREMPFVIPDDTSVINDLSSLNSSSIYSLLFVCLSFFISKYLFIALYLSSPVAVALFIHAILFCAIYQYSILITKRRSHFTYSEVITHQQYFLFKLMSEFSTFIGPYLSGTQLLPFLFRMLGAQIGSDVILPDIRCITDPHLVNIGDYVRLNMGAYIQAHTFEQRILKLAPITVNHRSVLMSNTLILPGATLQGQNHILPWTLVMKDDQLPPNTKWSGVPAKQVP